MKRNITIFIILFMVIIPLKLSAVSLNTGANVWYSWYEPGFKDSFMGNEESTARNNNFEMTESAAFVYGGLFSVQFTDRISVGLVLSYGTGWKCKADYVYTPASTTIHMYKNLNDISRFEDDLTINYALNSTFKIFFGWKYFAERAGGNYYYYPLIAPAMIFEGDFEIQFDSTGPGAGLTSNFNIADNFYMIITISGIYQKSKTKINVTGITNSDDSGVDKSSKDFSGGNGLLNLAYVIPETGVTLSLGGRYQYLKDWKADTVTTFYGVMLSAIYTFNI